MDLFGSCLGRVVGFSVRPSTSVPGLPVARISVKPGADSSSIARRFPGYHESRTLWPEPGHTYPRCNSDIQRRLGYNGIGMAPVCSQSVVFRLTSEALY